MHYNFSDFIKENILLFFRERIDKLPRSSANRTSKFFETLKINHIVKYENKDNRNHK